MKLTAKQENAAEEFRAAWRVSPGKCADNPGPWTDYEDDEAPSKPQAERLCGGCPILNDCWLYAEALRPTHGVWAGRVWIPSEPNPLRGNPR